MPYRVLKPFQTPTHRFAEGAQIAAADLDGPLTAADWIERGHLEETTDRPAPVSSPSAAANHSAGGPQDDGE